MENSASSSVYTPKPISLPLKLSNIIYTEIEAFSERILDQLSANFRKMQPWLDWPYMKCLVAFTMYAIIQIALIATKNNFNIMQWPLEPEPDGDFSEDLKKLSQNDLEIVPPFNLLNFYIFVWVIGQSVINFQNTD